jgi:lipopolysaccharide/colanic/teichoic acid biosynthesis glycosyltransferase
MTRTRSEAVTDGIELRGFIAKPGASSLGGEVRKLFGRLVLSPFFLFVSLLVLYLVPESLVRMSRRSWVLGRIEDRLDRVIDIGLALTGLLLFSPLCLLVVLLIRLESPGPILYRQTRVGKNYRNGNGNGKVWLSFREVPDLREKRESDLLGRPFELLKFRTMSEDAELHTGPVWAEQEDPRVTRIGRILRSTYLDEIPQLVNVLRGDMSIIGPRPERPYFTLQLGQQISNYQKRFSVKPGITGLAQVRQHADLSIADVKTKLKYDVFYCQKRCVILRMKILGLTVLWALKRAVSLR